MEETSTLSIQDGSNELLPPKDNVKVGRAVFQLLEQILQYKADQGLPAKWHRCYELSKGKHWRKETRKATLVTANLLFTHRQRTVAMLTDNNPTFNATQSGELPPEKVEEVDILRHTTTHWWAETEQQDIFETSVINGETYGFVCEKVRFDPNAEYGIGEVVTDEVDPYHFGWYPCDQKDNQKAQANLHYWPMPIREARRRWPDMAGSILPDEEWIDQLGDGRKDVLSPMTKDKDGFFARIGGVVKNMLNTAEQQVGKDDRVLIVEAWVKDYTTIRNGDGTTQDLYPGNVRTIWTCNGGEVVLEDRQNASINWEVLPVEAAAQTFLFDKFPFNAAVSVKDTTSPFGMTDFEQLESLNIEMNKTLSQITLAKDKASRITIINPTTSGVSNKDFNNAYGIINPKNHMVAESIRVLEQAKIPPEMTQVFQLYRELFFLVSGSFDMEQADAPGSNAIAYKAIAALLERVATLLRGKLRNYHRLIRNRGRMYLSCAMNWYIDERWISYTEDGQQLGRKIKGPDMIIPAKLSVVSGSTMPVSKVQQREEALELRSMGAIDDEELLKKLEWEDYKRVVERMKRGPIGIAMDRLVQLGIPPEVGEYFVNVGTMDEKDFDKALENGELPGIDQVLTPQAQIEGEQEPETSPVDNAEVELKQAQARKVEADIELVMEKIESEKVNQQVALAGVDFDRDKLIIERAKTAADIKRTKKEDDRQDIQTVAGLEKDASAEGRSDKAEARSDKDELRKDAQLASELETKEAEQRAQGPYRERGGKSNNIKK